jgi:hypothetical protein
VREKVEYKIAGAPLTLKGWNNAVSLSKHITNNLMKNRILALAASLPVATLGFGGIALAGDDVVVINSNSAHVVNVVKSKADTGDNWAGGSTGGNGGNGGSVSNVGSGNDADDNTTGAAGAGGNAGVGGTVITGSALSSALVENHINSNETEVDACGCEEGVVEGDGAGALNDHEEEEDGDDVFVKNKNRAHVKNIVKSKADSGDNDADGSTGGNGGNGGSVSNVGEDNDADDNTTGPAGAGGTGSDGGWVATGAADSLSAVVNYINRNITRITR